jgi:vitamin K-dependent gamma-carboxylase
MAPRVLVGSVYLWAAVAKLDGGWLAGRSMRVWLGAHADLPLVGSLLVRPVAAPALAWAGLVFDLLIVPALAWRRTRTAALGAVVCFHVATAALFPLGVFPWLMVGAALGAFAPRWLPWVPSLRRAAPVDAWRGPRRVAVAALLGLCALAPVRAVLPGSRPAVDGTGDHLAWRVMDHDRAGFVVWVVTDRATGDTWEERPSDHLAPHQVRQLGATVSLLPVAARAVREAWARAGRDVEVRAEAVVSVDGGRAVPVADPDVDLSRVGWTFGHPGWAPPSPAGGRPLTGP